MSRYSLQTLLAMLALLTIGWSLTAEAEIRNQVVAQAPPEPEQDEAAPQTDEEAAPAEGEAQDESNQGQKSKRRARQRQPGGEDGSEAEAPPPQRQGRRKAAPPEAPPPEAAKEEPPAAESAPVAAPEQQQERPQRQPAQEAAPAQPAEPAQAAEPSSPSQRKREATPTEEAPAQRESGQRKEPPRDEEKAATPPPQAAPAQSEKAAPPAADRARKRGAASDATMEAIKKQRRQRSEDGGKRTVIEEPGDRVIIKEGDRAVIRHDETERLRRTARDIRREKRRDGTSVTIAVRPGGIEVYSVYDDGGRLVRRYRRGKDGREVTLIDNRYGGDRDRRGDRHRGDRRGGGIGFYLDLGPPRIDIPRSRYIVEYDSASEEDVYDALMAPPVERLERGYTLDEIRYNRNLRDRMRRIDLDTVNFEFGSWQVAPSQYGKLERVARAINRVLRRRPDEMFLVEGHTDAVGSDIDNLTLSDRRAEEVAYILSESFDVPPENLVTQGYGEEFLKIDTQAPERANRRVAVRRITPLLSRR